MLSGALLDYRRRRLLKKAPEGPLRDYLSVPFPSLKTDCREVPYMALDLETTGLSVGRDAIVSVGYVAMRGTRIDLATATRRLVAPNRTIPEESAVIHHITDDVAATGEPLASVLGELLPRLAGRVMIAHHAQMEFSFLSAACKNIWGVGFLIPVVDPQWIERRTLELQGKSVAPKELRLSRLRERYNLPRYRAHDALSDALAAAELFAAQLAERDHGGPLPLKHFLARR